MWTIRGRLKGRSDDVLLTWDAGTLTGDELAIREMMLEYAVAAGRGIGPVGGPFVTNHRTDAGASAILAGRIFEPGYRFTGVGAEPREELPERRY